MDEILVGTNLPFIGDKWEQVGKCCFNGPKFSRTGNIQSSLTPGCLHSQLVCRCIAYASLRVL